MTFAEVHFWWNVCKCMYVVIPVFFLYVILFPVFYVEIVPLMFHISLFSSSSVFFHCFSVPSLTGPFPSSLRLYPDRLDNVCAYAVFALPHVLVSLFHLPPCSSVFPRDATLCCPPVSPPVFFAFCCFPVNGPSLRPTFRLSSQLH